MIKRNKSESKLPVYKEFIDYGTWEQMVIVSFSRKSGIKKSLAKSYLTSLKFPGTDLNFLKKSYELGRNAEAIAKVLWCEYHNAGNEEGKC